jgi:hypothetical protein
MATNEGKVSSVVGTRQAGIHSVRVAPPAM